MRLTRILTVAVAAAAVELALAKGVAAEIEL